MPVLKYGTKQILCLDQPRIVTFFFLLFMMPKYFLHSTKILYISIRMVDLVSLKFPFRGIGEGGGEVK